jgi:hypothetical protein
VGGSPDFTFDAVKHSILRQACTDLAAFLCIIYDPSGSFSDLADAEIAFNTLWNSAERSLSMLSDPRVVTFEGDKLIVVLIKLSTKNYNLALI